MPRIEYQDLEDDEQSVPENTIRIKIPKPPVRTGDLDNHFPAKRHKEKKREVSRFDKRNIESL